MADDEMESFEITDYDLQNEFTGHHSRRKMTKEQQIYGMWADNSDGEENEVAPKMSAKHALKKGMSFVAGGIQQSGKKNKDKEQQEDSPQETSQNIAYNSSDDEQFGKPALGFKASTDNRRKYKKMAPNFKEGGIGEWEKHTTGIGSKLMKQMGYKEGQGLGKNLQGISTPVEANKRRGKGAIGFYGDERPKARVEPDSEEEEKSKFEEQLQQWRKRGGRKKIKYVYKTAEEAINEGKTKGSQRKSDSSITKTKVIDMTGPETRVLSSYDAIAGQKPILNDYEEVQNRSYEHFDVSELIHNVQLLLEHSEEDIVKNAKDLEKAENRIVHLNHEREKYDSLLDQEEKDMEIMDGAMEILTELEDFHKQNKMTLDIAKRLFSEFQSSYSQVFRAYEIVHLAPTYITNLLREALSGWEPLKQPTLHLEEFTKWQQLIEMNPSSSSITTPGPEDQLDPYHQIVWHTWTPVVRGNILNTWNPKDTEDILKFLEIWTTSLIPNWIRTHLLTAVIMPRITQAVNNWSPSVDRVPIEKWIHPWLPILSDQLQTVYPVIRQKLSSALTLWHPSDQSAKLVLEPWKNVFSEVSMTTLIQTHIQPKLERALLEVPISPNHQILDAWFWFSNWQDMLPTQIIVQMLEKCFFPQWYQALGIWLSAKPPYGDVVAWYKGWRDVIPAKAHSHFQVRQKFQQYLEISRRALSYQPGASEQFSLLLSGLENISAPPPPPPLGSPPKPKDWARIIGAARRENTSVKDLVENKCQEQGILFIPLVERRHEGRPVYRCGSQTISFNKNIIYVHTERGWVPRSLSVVLDDA